ncbi:hypothetical protein IUY40_00075 [Flavobacterium sp. ALJ2]|nr:hypothetical protein [Flavobacterium sp. ALJ2]
MKFFKDDIYTSKELVAFAENDPQKAFDSWKLLYNKKTGLTKNVEDLNLVSKNIDEINKAGGYLKWKGLLKNNITKTLPSKTPNLKAFPKGKKTKISDLDDIETRTSLTRENEGADILAKRGYDIEQNPTITNTTRNPDYKIEGEIFDCYSPYNPNKSVSGIWDEISQKVIIKKQTERIFLHLKNWEGKIDDLQKQFDNYPVEGLKEVMILDKNNEIIFLTLK